MTTNEDVRVVEILTATFVCNCNCNLAQVSGTVHVGPSASSGSPMAHHKAGGLRAYISYFPVSLHLMHGANTDSLEV